MQARPFALQHPASLVQVSPSDPHTQAPPLPHMPEQQSELAEQGPDVYAQGAQVPLVQPRPPQQTVDALHAFPAWTHAGTHFVPLQVSPEQHVAPLHESPSEPHPVVHVPDEQPSVAQQSEVCVQLSPSAWHCVAPGTHDSSRQMSPEQHALSTRQWTPSLAHSQVPPRQANEQQSPSALQRSLVCAQLADGRHAPWQFATASTVRPASAVVISRTGNRITTRPPTWPWS